MLARTRALDRVGFALHPGEVHALVGENGAGKSTLIKVLTGVHRLDGGELRHRGAPVAFARPVDAQRAGISTIYQEVNLVPLRSVAANVFLGRQPRRFGLVDRRRMEAEARELLSGYGIDVDVRRPLGTLGVGTQQMVALARAASVKADVVIMDEPTSSLEPREVETLFSVIERLHADDVAIVYVSHRLDELYRICDRVTVLRDGRVVHTGALKELSRLQLVAHMLGRSVGDVREHGATRFSDRDGPADAAPLLRAEHLTGAPRLADVSVAVAPGEVVGLAGLLGSGRSETARAILGALPRRGTVSVDGKPLPPGNVAAAMRAGVVMLAEDRKTDGILPHLSVRENIVLAALPQLSRRGVVSRARHRGRVRRAGAGTMTQVTARPAAAAPVRRQLLAGLLQRQGAAAVLVAVVVIAWIALPRFGSLENVRGVVLQRTRFGETVFATGGAEASALLMGLPVARTKIAVYTASGMLAGLAGTLTAAYLQSGVTVIGVGTELDAIAAVVIGGTLLTGGAGSVLGTLVGVLLRNVLSNVINQIGGLDSNVQSVISGAFLLVVVVAQRLLARTRA